MITKEQKLRNIRSFNKTKLSVANALLNQKLDVLETTVNDISTLRNNILNIQRKCDL